MPSATDFRRAFGLEPGVRLSSHSDPAAGSKRRRGAAAPTQRSAVNFEVVSVHVGHEALTRNERYAFPTELLLGPVGSAKKSRRGRSDGATSDDAAAAGARDAAAALREALRDRYMVYSAYGSPYECAYELGTLKLRDEAPPGTFSATVRGIATRRRDVPTKAQEAQQRRAAHSTGEGTTAEDDYGDAAQKQAAKDEERSRVRVEAKQRGLRVVISRFGHGFCAACGASIGHGQLIARPEAADGAGARGGWEHADCALQPRTPRCARAS